MSQANRIETMAVKLAVYAQRAGADPEPLLHAYHSAVQKRLRILKNVFDRDLLHPARTALILIEDGACADATVLASGALAESEFPALRVEGEEIRSQHGPAVAALVEALPTPVAGDELLERLVVARHDVALIAVAERLDHARHLHFRDRELWQPFYGQVLEVYLPFARRISGPIALRFERWARAFAQRLGV